MLTRRFSRLEGILERTIKLLFLGDFLLSGQFVQQAQTDPGWNPFTDPTLAALIQRHDIVVGSLDCTLVGKGRTIEGDRIILKTDSLALAALRKLNVSVVTLATNHAFDFGADGFEETQMQLSRLSVLTVGAGKGEAEAYAPVLVQVSGLRLACLAAADLATSAVGAGPGTPGVASLFPVEQLEAQVRSAKSNSDLVFVLLHWGTEWYRLPAPEQRSIARRLVRAGADAIIGNHPHVIQAFEYVEQRPVFYALGNAVAADVPQSAGCMLKQLRPNLESLAVSIGVSTGELRALQVWKLEYSAKRGLTVRGMYRAPFVQQWAMRAAPDGPFYRAIWAFYCGLMELVFIPVRYCLFGHGVGYALKRFTIGAWRRRLRALSARASVGKAPAGHNGGVACRR